MAKKLTLGDDWDWNLSDSQKKMTSALFGLITVLAWAFYSTPATINIAVEFTKSISILGIPKSGIVLGVIGALIVSIAELAFLYLTVWKSIYFIIPTLLCGFISVMGTVVFIGIGSQEAAIRQDSIDSYKTQIETLQASIASDNDYLGDLDKKAQSGNEIPSWILARKRQAIERKTSKENELTKLLSQSSDHRQEVGAIVTIGDKSWNIFFAIFIELVLIGSGLICILIEKTESSERPEQFKKHNRYFTENEGKIGFQIAQSNDQIFDKNLQFLNEQKFQRLNQRLNKPEFKPELKFHIDENIIKSLKSDAKKTGKSDKTILYLYDQGMRNKSAIGRQAGKILKGNRKKISQTYVSRVIKQNR